MRLTYLSIALMALLTFSACTKDDPTPAPPTKTELIARNWKITALSGTFAPLPAIDLYAQMPACEKDNILKVSSNGTYISDEGPTKCNAADPQTENGTWTFSSNETKLTIDTETFDIVSLSATSLVLTQAVAADPVGGTPAGTINVTLTAQ